MDFWRSLPYSVLRSTEDGAPAETVAFLLASMAVAVLMYYTPDYLHLSVAPEKKRRWEINLRWRIAGAALLLGLLLAPSNGGSLFAFFAASAACRRKLDCAQENSSAKSSSSISGLPILFCSFFLWCERMLAAPPSS